MRVIWLILAATMLCVLGYAQQIINNTDQPKSKHSGRVVELVEISTISDESGDFFFKRPNSFRVAQNGDLFIRDSEQLLQFGINGDFKRNFFVKGEGPGEMTSMTGFEVSKEEVIICCDSPSKIMKMDIKGNLIKEIPMKFGRRLRSFEFFHNNEYFFFLIDWERMTKFDGVIDLPHELISMASDGVTITKHTVFPTKVVNAMRGGVSGGYIPVDRLFSVQCKDKYLIVSHTEEYLLTLFNAESKQIIKFNRPYLRIKATGKNDKRPNLRITLGRQTFQAPKRNYLYDVEQLWVNGEVLWVLTSTYEEGKGFAVDVFDMSGTYIDMFFLKLPEKTVEEYFGYYQMAVSGDFFYATEKDKDENYIIKKYKIVDN